jgi:hypothetical protein
MPWFRESEIRHGRTAMLAVVGFIATDFVRIPGEMYSFEAIPKTIDAHDALLKTGPMYQLLLFIGLFDIVITGPAAVAASNGEREPGGTLPVRLYFLGFFYLRELISFFHLLKDFGWTAMAPKDSAKMASKKASEMLNGRLAMCAVGGIATQSVITGHGFPYL